MAITLSPAEHSRLFTETATAPLGEFDAVCSYPAALGQREIRWFELRDGLELAIDKFCLKDALVMTHCDRHHPLEYTFERSCQRIAKFLE